jgi:hypothetical protein
MLLCSARDKELGSLYIVKSHRLFLMDSARFLALSALGERMYVTVYGAPVVLDEHI